MRAVVHSTPGLIPIEAFTVMGLSAKPSSTNPIGRFGTGLKYAIAVLVRMDIKVTLFIGLEEYIFYKVPAKFRGQDYHSIRMKKRKGPFARWTYHTLPFTTQYGRDWVLWQVFRELEANTRDEQGSSYLWNDSAPAQPLAGRTLFVIEGSAYIDAFLERDKIFLPDGASVRTDSENIQVLNRPSKHIYFRGMRVMDLKHEAMFTYNFLQDIDLTEDRTVKHPFMVEALIVGYMQESNDRAFIQAAVAKPKQDSFERHVSHATAYTGTYYSTPKPSSTYVAAAKESPNPTAKEVWNQQQPTVPTSIHFTVEIPKPSLTVQEWAVIASTLEMLHPDAKIIGGNREEVADDVF